MLDRILQFIAETFGADYILDVYTKTDPRGWTWEFTKYKSGKLVATAQNDTDIPFNTVTSGNRYLDYASIHAMDFSDSPLLVAHGINDLGAYYIYSSSYAEQDGHKIIKAYFDFPAPGTKTLKKGGLNFILTGHWKKIGGALRNIIFSNRAALLQRRCVAC